MPKPDRPGEGGATDRSDENGQVWRDLADEPPGEGASREQERSRRGEHTGIDSRH